MSCLNNDVPVRMLTSNFAGVHKTMNIAALTLLSTCTNIEFLSFDCDIGYLRQPAALARQFYRDGHYFLEAIGNARGQRDAAVDVLELSDSTFDQSNVYWRSEAEHTDVEKLKERFRTELRELLT